MMSVALNLSVSNQVLYEQIREQVFFVWQVAKSRLSDGVTISDIWGIVQVVAVSVIEIVEPIVASEDDKKMLLLDIVDEFYIREIKPLDLPWVPNAIEDFVDRTIGEAIRPTVSWLFDRVFAK